MQTRNSRTLCKLTQVHILHGSTQKSSPSPWRTALGEHHDHCPLPRWGSMSELEISIQYPLGALLRTWSNIKALWEMLPSEKAQQPS